MSAPVDKRRIRLFWVLLIFFCWLIYSPLFSIGFYDEIDWLSMQFGYRYADTSLLEIDLIDDYITEPLLQGEPIRFIFTTAYWWLITYKWWGANAYFHHVAAFLLLLLCFSQIYRITKKLTESDWTALFATMLFALFPFNPRFIGQGYLVIYLLLNSTFLLSLSLYLSILRSQSSMSFRALLYLLSLFLFLLSTWSHESAYALPALLLGMDLIWTKSKGKLSIIKSSLRTAPYFLLLALQIGVTIYFALKLQSADGVRHEFSKYISYPSWATLRFVLEGFGTPFYEGYRQSLILPLASVLCLGWLLVFPIFSWRAQHKTVLLIGLFWAGITLFPALPILGSPLHPPEAEDKYFFLAQGGFCLLLATLAIPKGKVKKHWRVLSMTALMGLLIVYWIGINANSRYFLEEGRRYALTTEGLKEAIGQSEQARVVCFLYGDSQPDRERMLSAFLEVTQGQKESRAWFFLDRATLLPLIDGRFPDHTLPKPIQQLTSRTGTPGMIRGGYKKTFEFVPIQFSYDPALILLGFDPATGRLSDLRRRLLPVLSSPTPPSSIDAFRFSREGEASIQPNKVADQPAEAWFVQGNVYRLFPESGRF